MKRTYYLIDTENVGDRWIDFIDRLEKDDVLVVFYTKNHSRLLEEHYLKQRYNKQIRWVECVSGYNALDHQLEGVLSYLIATHADAEYCIYSNDQDYKEAIDLWKEKGVTVSRVGFDPKKKKNKAKKSEPAAPASIQSPIPEEQVMEEIARAVPVSDMGGWYTVLVLLLGQEKGRELYTGLKSDEDLRDRLSNCLLSGETERSVHLVTLLYRQQQLDTAKAEKTVKIVKAHSKKNKKAVKADMDKCFGKEVRDVSPYYKVIKPVIPILKGK